MGQSSALGRAGQHCHLLPTASLSGISSGICPCWQEWANPHLTFSAWVGLTTQRVTGMMGRDLGLPVSFPSPQGVSQSLPPLAPFSAGRAAEGSAGALEELPAERLVSPSFLIPVLLVGSEFPNLNLCIPREWQCSESTLLFSFLCGFF